MDDNQRRIEGERTNVRKLIRYLKARGFELACVFDGEETRRPKSEGGAMDCIFAVDECRAYFRKAGTKAEHGVYLVFGNSPEEIICDWSFAKGDPDGFDAAMEEFSDNLMEAR